MLVAPDLLYLLLLVSTALASLVNVSIDDTYGDLTTGKKPVYQPSGPWAGPNCPTCAIVPSTALAFDGTWTAATYHPNIGDMNITFSFTGVSIWVFFILANANSIGPAITTNTNCNFTLDGNLMGSFNHEPDMSTYNLQYNVTAFSIGGLSNIQHTLVISTNDYPNSTFINFDYAIYTMDVSESRTSSNPGYSPTGGISSTPSGEAHNYSSSSKSGIVIGSVVGSLAFVVVVAILILFRRHLRKKRGSPEPIVTTFNQQTPQSYRGDDMRSSHLPWQSSIYTGNPGSATAYSQQSPIRSPLSEASGSTVVPFRRQTFAHNNKSRDELRAVRQMEIHQRLQNAEQEMHNLTSRRLIHDGPDASSEYGRQETEHEMGSMREQIRELRDQIERLQAERSSDWAQGLSDEPPPAYH